MICANCGERVLQIDRTNILDDWEQMYVHVYLKDLRACGLPFPAIYGEPTPGIRAWPPKSRSTSGPRQHQDRWDQFLMKMPQRVYVSFEELLVRFHEDET